MAVYKILESANGLKRTDCVTYLLDSFIDRRSWKRVYEDANGKRYVKDNGEYLCIEGTRAIRYIKEHKGAFDDLTPIEENSRTRVKKALFGDTTNKIRTFAILTSENPMGNQSSRKENEEKRKSLQADLKDMGIQYTKVKGKYGNSENSYILYNLSYSDAEDIARKYGQESFFYGTNDIPSEITYYETSDDGKTYKEIETSKKINNMSDAEDFFTRSGDFKFSIDMDYFKESLEIESAKIFNEGAVSRSMEEGRTPYSKMIARRASRRNF